MFTYGSVVEVKPTYASLSFSDVMMTGLWLRYFLSRSYFLSLVFTYGSVVEVKPTYASLSFSDVMMTGLWLRGNPTAVVVL